MTFVPEVVEKRHELVVDELTPPHEEPILPQDSRSTISLPRITVEKCPERVRSSSRPPPSPDDASSVICAPDTLSEDAARRMEWIMQMGMDAAFSSLRPEQRKIIETTKDLRALVVSLFQSWETFRMGEGRGSRSRKVAKSMYDKWKSTFSNCELFEQFWKRKMAAEADEASWGRFKKLLNSVLAQVGLIDRFLGSVQFCNGFSPAQAIFGVAAQKTYDAFEMLSDTFDRLYLFVLRLHESLSAKMITSTMLETYALVVIHVFKIVVLATRYAQQGNRFYWKSLFDPQDELFKLVAGFNQYAVQEIAAQVSQINLLLERQSTALDGLSRDVGLILQESHESSYHVRRTSELLEKMSADGMRAAVRTFHQEIETLKKWLKVPPNTEDDFTTFKLRKMRGTCEWIFADPRFELWRIQNDPASALLWIHARAGRGKSVLAATIIQHLQHATRSTGDTCVYFFCRSDDEAKKTPQSILRSTAYWLAQRNEIIRKRLMELCDNYPELRIEELPLASLWDRLFMQRICDRLPPDVPPFKIYWVIDALDECESNSAFTKMLAELGEEHCGVSFRLLFLSRYVPEIAKVADTALIPTIDMRISDNDHDIQKFIDVNIRASSLGNLNKVERQSLTVALKERANGSFLWVKLVMEELEGRRSMRAIEEALSEIPANRSLADIYQLTLNSMASSCDQEDLDIAREIFMWTLCSPRPLSLDELTAALEASMETRMMDVERAIKETCGSLIEVVDVNSQKQVMAVHTTLREFMQSEMATGVFAFSKAKAHAHIARTCLNYLLRPEFSKPFTPEKDIKMDPAELAAKYRLLKYASRFWSYHLVSNLGSFDPAMDKLLHRFLQSRNVLTSIEAITTFGSLSPLQRFSDDLRKWLGHVPSTKEGTRQWISLLPLEYTQEQRLDSVIARWALDFRRLKQRFQHSLLRYPRSIHESLPSFCPTNSMIFKLGAEHAEISISNPTSLMREWDNRLSLFRVPGFVRTMVCSPKSPIIASAVDSPVVMIWDAGTGQAIRPLKGHKDLVYNLAFSKDGQQLASGGKDEGIIVWNVERGHEMFQLKGHLGAVHAVAYSFSGEQIASGGEDGTVRIWQVYEDRGKLQHTLAGHFGTVYTLKYHSDNVQLCSSGEDGFVFVWHASRGILLKKFNVNLKWMGRLSFHPSWHYILISSEREPNNVQIWNIQTCEVISTIKTPSPVRCWKYDPSGKYIVTGHLDGRVRVWDANTTTQIHMINEDAWSIRFSNSGKYLICLIRYISRWQVRTWDFEQEMKEMFKRKGCGCPCNQQMDEGHRVIHALTVNMDNSRLATVTVPHAGTWNGQVKLWNPSTAKVLWEQEQVFRSQDCVAPGFSPDGRYLACYDYKNGSGGEIILVDAVVPTVIDRIPLPSSIDLVSLAVDLHGRGLAISTRENLLDDDDSPPQFFLYRHHSEGRRPIDVVTTRGTHSMALSYTADGTKLLVAARDRHESLHIIIWDTKTQRLVRQKVYDEERYIWFKMFGGFRLLGEDRIVLHLDHMPRDAIVRSHWGERMLVLTPDGEEVQRFEAGSSRMTISQNRVIFLDNEYWIVSWDGHSSPKRHAKLPVDVGFAVSGLSFCEGKLTLVSRTEGITVVEIGSLK